MKQKRVWILSGCPGSGKSTWAKKRIQERGGIYCSRDEIRFSLLKDGEDYFSHEDEVIRIWKEEIYKAINSPEDIEVYIDATHLTDKVRNEIISSLPIGNYTVSIVIFDIPLETCLERNAKRTGRAYVPPQVIHNMYSRFEKTSMCGDDIVYITEENENDISNIRHTF